VSVKQSTKTFFLLVGSTAAVIAAVGYVTVPSLLRARVSVPRSVPPPPATTLAMPVPFEQRVYEPKQSPMRTFDSAIMTRKELSRLSAGVPGGVEGGVAGGVAGGILDGFVGGNADMNTEAYHRIVDNAFRAVADAPLSSFSVDVDTASYANVRRFLRSGQLPPKDAVRIEEMINYFHYDHPAPEDDRPFAVRTSVAECPWAPQHKLVLVGLQARAVDEGQVPPRNLVFLLDVSGSMAPANKLPLLKEAMGLLVDRLTERDRISIVVYAGASGLVLPPTPGNRKGEIRAALAALQSGGSTAGAAGIQLAYEVARESFIDGGVNRVILATDGDFNVGVSSEGELSRLIEAKRKTGVSLSVLGFGEGNLKDATMEMLADKGDGNYSYVDSLTEARKVLVTEAGSTLVMVAKDVKLQVEFNPAAVDSYRLIGYENRVLADADFNDDAKDAGDMGAGHSVTALYEVVPAGAGAGAKTRAVDPLKYQEPRRVSAGGSGDELMTVKLRYKQPDGDTSRLLSVAVKDGAAADSPDIRFAAAVASFGMVLRDSEHKGSATFASVLELARSGVGDDRDGLRADFVKLVQSAQLLGGSSREARIGVE
jgi:Ca-activated chloride channel family protein